MLRREQSAVSRAVAVADAAHRIAVLLQAGVAPHRAWEYLAQVGDAQASAVYARLQEGESVVAAIAAQGSEWQAVAATWRIANDVGAPLAETLRSIAAAMRDAAETADDIRVALAEPAMTARLMLWLPAFGLLLGALLGFDTLTVLVTNPIGLACLIVGVALLGAARFWTRRLVGAASGGVPNPGLRAELTAVALSGGISIARATTLVDDAHRDAAPVSGGQGSAREAGSSTDRVLELSRLAGVPAVELLRASAADERRAARTSARLRASQLGTRLLLPLALCTLPAFFLLGVAPLVLSVITSTVVTW